MTTPTFRIHERAPDGQIQDRQFDMSLDDFGGQCPTIGDLIVAPGVLAGLDRSDPLNRHLWAVVGRVFNPRDLSGYIALIVEERIPTAAEAALVAG